MSDLVTAKKEGELRLNNVYHLPLGNRRCSSCKKRYLRRNITEMWTVRAEGCRYGWQKDTAKICMDCMDEAESNRIIGIADVQYRKTVKMRAV